MGQISPLDQLIYNSAFNNCSVTVIYSGVIITDVLLLCDWPVGPLALIVLCRCDRVFWDYSGLFLLWCFAFSLLPVLLKCTFASVA